MTRLEWVAGALDRRWGRTGRRRSTRIPDESDRALVRELLKLDQDPWCAVSSTFNEGDQVIIPRSLGPRPRRSACRRAPWLAQAAGYEGEPC